MCNDRVIRLLQRADISQAYPDEIGYRCGISYQCPHTVEQSIFTCCWKGQPDAL